MGYIFLFKLKKYLKLFMINEKEFLIIFDNLVLIQYIFQIFYIFLKNGFFIEYIFFIKYIQNLYINLNQIVSLYIFNCS